MADRDMSSKNNIRGDTGRVSRSTPAPYGAESPMKLKKPGAFGVGNGSKVAGIKPSKRGGRPASPAQDYDI